MNFDSVHNVYFLGIGGIGMSALARFFHANGKNVGGYDLSPSALTSELEQMGIAIHFDEAIEKIPQKFLSKENTLVVLTPAVPAHHTELKYFEANGFTIKKRAEVLGLLFNAKRGIAIAGTHGKTSVTSMTAFIMHKSILGCSAFLGGIVKNTSSNLILQPSSEWIVAEADEYDRSFLQLFPEIALITCIDADHMDIYDSFADIQQTFQKFLSQVSNSGTIILKKGIELLAFPKGIKVYSYALEDRGADFYASRIELVKGKYNLDIKTPDGIIENVTLLYPGLTNAENAIAAASASWAAGASKNEIASALNEFQGVQRRFDVQFENEKTIYIDDYAHHPRELDAIIGSVRKIYPTKKITGIFQPHLFSRTRDFADDFAKSLSALDELLLLEIYPAREKQIPGVTSKMLLDKVTLANKSICVKSDLLETLQNKEFDVLLTIGAGDIDRFIAPITLMLNKR